MFLFESGPSYQSRQIGVRDTIARFMYDLATGGIPMTLASVKAASDAIGHKRKVARLAAAAKDTEAKIRPLILPIGPLAGLP